MTKPPIPEKYVCTSFDGYQRARNIVKWLADAPLNIGDHTHESWIEHVETSLSQALVGVDYSDMFEYAAADPPELIVMGTNLYVRVSVAEGQLVDIPIVVEFVPS